MSLRYGTGQIHTDKSFVKGPQTQARTGNVWSLVEAVDKQEVDDLADVTVHTEYVGVARGRV